MKKYIEDMKRILLLISVVLLSMVASAYTYDVEIDGISYIIYYLGGDHVNYAVVTGASRSGDITIPASIMHYDYYDGYTNKSFRVEKISSHAFSNRTDITSVIIGENVKTIEYHSFYRCTGLTSITIPNNVYAIRDEAFSECFGLTSVTLGNGVTGIGNSAFRGCSGLISVTLGNSVSSIGYDAFNGCVNLASIVVESGNKEYDSRDNCNAIVKTSDNKLIAGCKSTIIPHTVTNIGDYAFKGCSGLTSITIPNNVTNIGNNAFQGCFFTSDKFINNSALANDENWGANLCDEETNEGLIIKDNTVVKCRPWATSVTISNAVTSIYHDAFQYCNSLTSVNIGNSVTSIGYGAFRYCPCLTSIAIPESVTSIGNEAFSGCGRLTDVFCYAEEVPETYSNAFSNSSISSATLHVPASSLEAYRTTAPWSSFGSIVALPNPTFNLTYIVDGKVYKTYEVEQGSPITPEPVPTKEGYTFFGWSEIPATMPAHDVTVNGSFTINSYVLTYMVDDAMYKSSEVEYGSPITPEPAPTKEGYTFSGWSEIPETMPANDVTVTGSFTVNSYTLTYIVDGEVYKTSSVEYGTALTPEHAPTKEGHTFSGWTGLPATMPSHDVSVTGSFSVNSYTLTYKVDGNVYMTFSVDYGTALTPEPAPTKEGHTFSGWTGLPATMPAHDVTVTGSFTINSYTLTYKVDGKVYRTFTVKYGYSLPSVPAPTKEGYTFMGWGGLPTTMPASDVLVEAQWSINKYRLTYVVEGSVYKSMEVDYHTPLTPIAAPVRKGMTFSGWIDMPGTMPAHNVTVTGTFSLSKKTVGKIIYQVADTLNNYVSVIGSNNISGSAEVLSSIEFGGDTYAVNTIGTDAFRNRSSMTSISIPKSVTSIGTNAFYGCNNIRFYVHRGSYALFYVWNNYNSDPYEIGTSTKLSHPYVSAISTTQTTITYQINHFYPELDYEVVGEVAGDNAYIITGLRPSYTQNIPLTVRMENISFSTSTNVTTMPISPTVVSKNITASSLTAQGSYMVGDAKVVSTQLTMNGTEMSGVEGIIHGLNPNTSYNCKYKVVVEYGSGDTYTYEGSANFRTAVLTLTTQQPRVITMGNVVVAAESNLDDEETKVGFEWRRTDWPDDFASNSGVAYLYEGTMEGYIRNLYIEKLWRYRPYYESDSGNRYYGTWVGIDPTNTSYFEPTVHTYATITVTGNRAEVKGYAMRGTDNVVSQGFMYWPGSTPSLRRKVNSVPTEAKMVLASGNVMTATLEDLEYETAYCYVAFVTTSEGENFFGEAQTFSTSVDPDGIEEIEDSTLKIEEAWYSLDGKKLAKPQKGINIIRYADGTTKKVLIK